MTCTLEITGRNSDVLVGNGAHAGVVDGAGVGAGARHDELHPGAKLKLTVSRDTCELNRVKLHFEQDDILERSSPRATSPIGIDKNAVCMHMLRILQLKAHHRPRLDTTR